MIRRALLAAALLVGVAGCSASHERECIRHPPGYRMSASGPVCRCRVQTDAGWLRCVEYEPLAPYDADGGAP